jgi:hemerythrin
MTFIKWKTSFSVNVVEIDRQHQKLVGIINDLYLAMEKGKGKEVVEKIITELYDYAATHFKMEERYFDQFGYPEADSHKKEHASFTKKVSEFNDGFQKGRVLLSIELMKFLSDWLQNHIKGSDKKYAPFFNERGLK